MRDHPHLPRCAHKLQGCLADGRPADARGGAVWPQGRCHAITAHYPPGATAAHMQLIMYVCCMNRGPSLGCMLPRDSLPSLGALGAANVICSSHQIIDTQHNRMCSSSSSSGAPHPLATPHSTTHRHPRPLRPPQGIITPCPFNSPAEAVDAGDGVGTRPCCCSQHSSTLLPATEGPHLQATAPKMHNTAIIIAERLVLCMGKLGGSHHSPHLGALSAGQNPASRRWLTAEGSYPPHIVMLSAHSQLIGNHKHPLCFSFRWDRLFRRYAHSP